GLGRLAVGGVHGERQSGGGVGQGGLLEVDFVAVDEWPAAHGDRAGRAGQGGAPLAVEVLRGEGLDGAPLRHHAGGEDLGRHAGDQADEVRVVDVQVDGGAAGLGGVADVGGPVGPGDDPGEVPAEQLAVLALADGPGGE